MAALKKQDCSQVLSEHNQYHAMAHDNSISQACTGIHLYKLIQLKNNP